MPVVASPTQQAWVRVNPVRVRRPPREVQVNALRDQLAYFTCGTGTPWSKDNPGAGIPCPKYDLDIDFVKRPKNNGPHANAGAVAAAVAAAGLRRPGVVPKAGSGGGGRAVSAPVRRGQQARQTQHHNHNDDDEADDTYTITSEDRDDYHTTASTRSRGHQRNSHSHSHHNENRRDRSPSPSPSHQNHNRSRHASQNQPATRQSSSQYGRGNNRAHSSNYTGSSSYRPPVPRSNVSVSWLNATQPLNLT